MAINSTSFTKTPQAGDDSYVWTEDQLLASGLVNGNVVTLGVMGNDLGGNAKTLYSIDDGNGNTLSPDFQLLVADVTNGVSAWEVTASNNWIRINNGKIEFKLGGSLATDAAPDFNSLSASDHIQDEFVYTIRLGNGTLSQARVMVDIQGQNDAATITASDSEDTAAVEAGGVANAAAGDFSASGTLTVHDVDGGENHFAAVPAGSLAGTYGNFTFDSSTGAWTYALDNSKAATQALTAGQPATDTLMVSSFDTTASRIITVNIAGTNDVPVLGGVDVGAVSEDASTPNLSASGALTIADVDQGQSSFTAQAGTAGGNGYGSFTLAADGSWSYTASNSQTAIQQLGAGESITDSFTAVSSDGTASQLVTVTINGTNDVPVLGGVDVGAVSEDASTPDLSASGALTIADVDQGQSNFMAQAGTAGSNGYGSFTLAADGSWNYTASNSQIAIQQLGAGESITDSFTAVSSDGTASQLVTVTINGTNDAPVAVADIAAGTENQTLTIDVLANDADVDNSHVFTLASASAPTGQGNASIMGDQLVFNPGTDFDYLAQDATATVTLSYGMTDEHGAPSNSTVTVTVTGTNDAPIGTATAILAAGTEDTAYTVSAANLLAGFSDVDGDTLSVSALSANHGSVADNGNGTFTIMPLVNYNGAVSLSYNVIDGHTGSIAATQSFSLATVNDAPALTGTRATLAEGTEDVAYIVSAANLLAGFSDVDADTLSVAGLTASHGTVVDDGNGAFTVTPTANYNGLVSLSYNVIDGQGGSVAATQSFNLAAVNDAPTVTSAAAVNFAENGVGSAYLATATDPEGSALSYSLSGADASLFNINSGTGAVTFVTAPNFEAPADAGANNVYNITVRASDGTLFGEQAVAVTVTDIVENQAPTDITLVGDPTVGTGYPNAIGILQTTDPDAGDTFIYTLLPGSSSGFSISGNALNGNLGNNQTYTLEIKTQDSGGAAFTETFNIITGSGPSETLPGSGSGSPVLVGDDVLYGFNNADIIYGGSGNDTLYGQSGNDELNGGDGSDVLYGGAGADLLNGGNGNDVLVFDPADISGASSTVYDGGAGSDTLRFDGAGMSLNLTTVTQSKIQNIENIDLAGTGNNALTLTLQDALDLSASTDQLVVMGNTGDSVTSTGQGWIEGANVTLVGQNYASYSAGLATLLIDTDITRNVT